MLIDWFTVGAQILNFLILGWLLKRFLYKPILDAIDGREKSIAKKLTDASAAKADARKEREDFEKKNAAIEAQRVERLKEVSEEVKAERDKLLDQARKAADALRAKRQDALKHEQQNLDAEIGRRTRDEIFAIARKLLADLAGTTLEERMSAVFAQRLRAMDGEAKQRLASAIKASADPVLVRSAFELPAAQQEDIQLAFKESFSSKRKMHFEIATELIAGVELSVDGQKLAWSADDYLVSLEKRIDDLLREQSMAVPSATAASESTHRAKLKAEVKTAHKMPR